MVRGCYACVLVLLAGCHPNNNLALAGSKEARRIDSFDGSAAAADHQISADYILDGGFPEHR